MSDPSPTELRNLKQTFKSSAGVLLPDIQRHVVRSQKDSDRDTDHVHPSDMAKNYWCPRQTYFRITGAETNRAPSSVSFRMANAFAQGHMIHDKWQRWLWEMGRLWGRWSCSEGHTFFAQSPSLCEECAAAHIHSELSYREVPLHSDEYLMIGHSDGCVMPPPDSPDKTPRLIEIKSIGVGTLRFEAPSLFWELQSGEKTLDQAWAEIQRPFRSHLTQGHTYLMMAQECYPELSEVTEIVFLYEWKATGDTREFVVKYDPTFIEDRLELARTVAISVRNQGKVLPEYPKWASLDCKDCKDCEYRDTCWGTDKSVPTEQEPRRTSVRVKKSTSRRKPRS